VLLDLACDVVHPVWSSLQRGQSGVHATAPPSRLSSSGLALSTANHASRECSKNALDILSRERPRTPYRRSSQNSPSATLVNKGEEGPAAEGRPRTRKELGDFWRGVPRRLATSAGRRALNNWCCTLPASPDLQTRCALLIYRSTRYSPLCGAHAQGRANFRGNGRE